MAVLKLQPDAAWPGTDVDPYVRLAVALIETEDENHVALLGSDPFELELLLELKNGADYALRDELQVPDAYPPDARHVTATLALKGRAQSIRQRVADLRGRVKRLKIAARQQPRLVESLRDMGADHPPLDTVSSAELDGRGSIIGIIDDGCAFAHRNFLKNQAVSQPVFKSRLLYLWDQTSTPKKKGGWVQPADFGYGWELGQDKLDAAIAARVSPTGKIDERKIYEAIDYTAVEVGSHGTHVMDIAAGNGESVTASRGVAPAADIIFVQIPKTAIGNPADSVLSSYILDGIMYVFARARALKRPAVVNISYGGYGGPHDGSSLVEQAIDELLAQDDRAVVVSAGNGFSAQCHASGTIPAGKNYEPLTWIVGENDPTLNLLEIWYSDNAKLEVALTAPNGSSLGPIALGGAVSIRQDDGLVVGWVFHRASESVSKSNHVVIALRPTDRNKNGTKVAPAPAGLWKVHLTNVGSAATEFHAWIERDDAGSRKAGIRLQSRFAEADSSPRCTLGSFATGKLAICVGAHNSATQEVCEYSACGPTRDNSNLKPDVTAPGEEDVAGDGILSVNALSSQPTRMNGTSAAAPHVAGLVALMFQWANKKPLSAKAILKALRQGAENGTLASKRPLRDHGRWPEKNAGFAAACSGAGKINVKETIDALSNPLP
jgi:subtilisin family serine protease